MTAKNLAKFDLDSLKGINAQQIIEFLKNRIDISVNILLIALTLYATIYFYMDNTRKLKNTQDDIRQMSEKLSITSDLGNLQQELDDRISRFPKPIASDQISNQLSSFAAQNGVQILSFSPAENKSDDYVNLTRVNMRIASADYDKIASFVRAIEDSNLAIKVESWSGNLSEAGGSGYAQRKKAKETFGEDLIISNIKIGSIQLKWDY